VWARRGCLLKAQGGGGGERRRSTSGGFLTDGFEVINGKGGGAASSWWVKWRPRDSALFHLHPIMGGRPPTKYGMAVRPDGRWRLRRSGGGRRPRLAWAENKMKNRIGCSKD
jgi:hypothetical protein